MGPQPSRDAAVVAAAVTGTPQTRSDKRDCASALLDIVETIRFLLVAGKTSGVRFSLPFPGSSLPSFPSSSHLGLVELRQPGVDVARVEAVAVAGPRAAGAARPLVGRRLGHPPDVVARHALDK